MKKDKIFTCYKKYILEFAQKKFPQIRKRKYSLKYYLDNFIHVLNDVTKWESLKYINKNNITYHWKSIYNEYKKWVNENIFDDALRYLLQYHYFKLSKVRKNKKMNILIDVTKTVNSLGSEKIGLNTEYKKKNVTSLLIACDEEKRFLGISPLNTNLNKTKTEKHTTLDSIPFKLKSYVKTNIVGDKAYITKEKFRIFGKDIKITTPKRKNQKIKNTKIEKRLLKKRYNIENFIATIKRKDRIAFRKDRKIKYYMSFIFMTLIEIYFKDAYRNDIDIKII